MKTYKLIMFAAAALLLTACADDKFQEYRTAAPERGAQYDYLNSYGDLKSYVNRSAYPKFRLGGALAATDFNKKEIDYALAVANFDEVVAGNEMKYASCVSDKGVMDFTKVKEFVNNAAAAGVNVYGHTLLWHEQQGKYPESIIKDREVEQKGEKFRCLVFTCGAAGSNPWDKQGVYTLQTPMVKGKKYTVKAKVKSSAGGDLSLWPIWSTSDNKNEWGGSNDVQYLAAYATSTSFDEFKWTFEALFDHDKLQFVFGKVGGNLFMRDISCKEEGSDVEMIVNGDLATDDLTNWSTISCAAAVEEIADIQEVMVPVQVVMLDFEGADDKGLGYWGATGPTGEIADGGHDGGKCFKIVNPTTGNSWEGQCAHDFDAPLENGKKYFLHFWAKADTNCELEAGFQDPAHGWAGRGNFPNFNLTTEWQEITISTTVTGEDCTRMLFSFGKVASTFYFDDIELYYEVSGSTVPLTEEEKKQILTNEQERWIKGMMEACGGQVKAWDLANETVSGGNADAEGIFDLQHAWNVSNPSGKFFWQDYIGDRDFVRNAVKFARQYGPKDIKLFINDYNLESDWDNNQKLVSLIKWIERWEEDGVTKIDGIGSQMHVSCYEDATKQKSVEDHIVRMLELMKNSGKLVRISELDMGFVDINGQSVETANVTEKQHHRMADFYKFIVKQYLKIIPAQQQWGICQWSLTDQPANSGWRKNEPTGLWDQNYYRKHTYAGFADGLSGK